MDLVTILIIVAVVIIIGVATWFFGRKKIRQQLAEQQQMISQYKQTAPIFVMEKKMAKLSTVKLPKGVYEQMPKVYRWKKMPLIKAKIGTQIMTFVCDKKLYEKIPDKKMIKADIAGIYIVSFKNK